MRKLFSRSLICSWSRFRTKLNDWLIANCDVCSRKEICRHFIDIKRARNICLDCYGKCSRTLLNDNDIGEYGMDIIEPDIDLIECDWFWDLRPICPMLSIVANIAENGLSNIGKISEFRVANANRVLAETAAKRAEYESRCNEIDKVTARKKKRKQLTAKERLLMKLSASGTYIPGSPEADPDSIRPMFPNKGFADND